MGASRTRAGFSSVRVRLLHYGRCGVIILFGRVEIPAPPEASADVPQPERVIHLTKSTLTYLNLATATGAVITTALAWVLALTVIPAPWDLRIGFGVAAFALVTGLVDVFVLNVRERRFFTMRVSEEAVVLHRGRFIETDAAVLRSAVVSVDVVNGPVLRRLGLAKLAINGIGRFPEIPPLLEAQARDVQAVLTGDRRKPSDDAGDE